jgi:hypothetical protein
VLYFNATYSDRVGTKMFLIHVDWLSALVILIYLKCN